MQDKNYINAEQILPPQLLEQVQKYAAGKLLYVPTTETEARPWGESTGQRSYYRKRNQMIRNKFHYGVGISKLAAEYFLSQETIKKIVYNRKEDRDLPFYPSAASAEQYGRENLLEEWVHTYLLFERKNKEFSEGLYREPRYYLGPLAMPLSLYSRSSGPEEHMKWRVHPVVWEEKVALWQQRIREQAVLPPLIVGYAGGRLELNCGSPLYEALVREEIRYYPVILWCSSEADQEDFGRKYLENMATLS